MPIPSTLNAPSSTGDLVRSAPERLARAHDVHRTVNAVCDGDPATEAAGVLDLHSDVEKAVAVKVAELIHRIQRRRELVVPARAQDSASLGTIGARQLQALGRPLQRLAL